MAFTVNRAERSAGVHLVTVKVSLSFSETNALFLSGDTIISWPEDGLLSASEFDPVEAPQEPGTVLVRTGMFISELARLAPGLKIGYRQAVEAERATHVIRLQLLRAGIEQEA